MNKTRWLVIAGASAAAAVLAAIIVLAMRPPKPSDSQWAMMLAASRVTGMLSAAEEACSLNPRPLVEVVHGRLEELRPLDKSERDQLTKEFASGMADVLPMPSRPSKELCDGLLKTATAAFESVGKTLTVHDLEQVKARLK